MQRQPDPDNWPELISTGKAAQYLGCSTQTMRNLIGSGFIDPAPLPMGDDGRSHYRVYSMDVFRLADHLEKERNNAAPNGQPYSLKGHRIQISTRGIESHMLFLSQGIKILRDPA